MTKNKKVGLFALLLVLIVSSIIGYYFYQKPVKDFANSKPDIEISAEDLFSQFAINEPLANTKYVASNKAILVNGKIKEINNNNDSSITILLDVNQHEASVSCTFNNNEELNNKIRSLSIGASIKVIGQCTGIQELISREVILIRCGLYK